jgi:tRNA(adenine34) deaminase
MCAAAMVHARVARLVFGAWDPRQGAAGSAFDLTRSRALNHALDAFGGVLADECGALLKAFFVRRRAAAGQPAGGAGEDDGSGDTHSSTSR